MPVLGHKTHLVSYENDSSILFRYGALTDNPDELNRTIELDVSCLDRPYNRYYLFRDADSLVSGA